ncbi:MAG: hypothetical protein ACI8PD_001814 [Nitrospinales bacterium]|jgi:hypothetical protein
MGGMNFIEVGPGAIGTKGFWGLKKTHPTEKGHEQIYFFERQVSSKMSFKQRGFAMGFHKSLINME